MIELEYLESSGTQWIETNIIPDYRKRLEIEFQYTNTNSSADDRVFTNEPFVTGVQGTDLWVSFGRSAGVYRFIYSTLTNTQANLKAIETTKHIAIYDDEFKLDSWIYVSGLSQVGTYPINLFGTDYAGYSYTNLSTGLRIFNVKQYDTDGSTLLYNLIPVRDDNNTACFYDTVNKQYYYNSGTGSFVEGPAVGKYTELEYIEGTGTQYINTNYIPMDSWIDMVFQGTANTSNSCIFGSAYNTYHLTWYDNRFYYGANAYTERNALGSYIITDKLHIIYNKNNQLVINDQVLDNNLGLTRDQYTQCGILHRTNESSAIIAAGKIYSFKMYSMATGKLLLDLIPVKDENNVVCMYDLISDTFYRNAGTGNFTAGPEVSKKLTNNLNYIKEIKNLNLVPANIKKDIEILDVTGTCESNIDEAYTPVEYIKATGCQCINTDMHATCHISYNVEYLKYVVTNAWSTIIGARNGVGSSNTYGIFTGISDPGNDSNFYYCKGNSSNHSSRNVLASNFFNKKVTASCMDTRLMITSNSGAFFVDYTWQEFGEIIPYYLMALNDLTLSQIPAEPAYVKLFKCNLYNYDQLLREMIPAKDKNSVPCLYDKYEKKFYYNYNANSAPFVIPVIDINDYTEIDYLESTGAQCIATDILLDYRKRLEVDFQYTSMNSTADDRVFCTVESNPYTIFGRFQGNFRFVYGNAVEVTCGASDTNRHTATYDSNFKLDNTTYASGLSQVYSEGSRMLKLFSNISGVNRIYPANNLRIYEVKQYDTDGQTLLHDLKPMKDENGIACLVDVITNESYYAGDFVIDASESEYTELEYIESTGTQYINTGVIPSHHSIEIKFQYTANIDNSVLFGVDAGYSMTWYNNKWYWGSNGNYAYGGDTYLCTNLNTMIYNQDSKLIINNNIVDNSISADSTGILYILNRPLAMDIYTHYASAKIFYFKVYDNTNNTLVRDFIPVKDENGRVCLYDQVNEQFYYNNGTGEFIGGAEV